MTGLKHAYGLCGSEQCSGFRPCASCDVVEDALLERGITQLGGLDTAVHYHPQAWALRDVKALPVAVDNGEDEPNFTWIVGFMDGRWAAVRGWHDYTGWDCQSGLYTEWYASEEAAMRTLVDWERDELDKERNAARITAASGTQKR